MGQVSWLNSGLEFLPSVASGPLAIFHFTTLPFDRKEQENADWQTPDRWRMGQF
jgi:hypothetical protein